MSHTFYNKFELSEQFQLFLVRKLIRTSHIRRSISANILELRLSLGKRNKYIKMY